MALKSKFFLLIIIIPLIFLPLFSSPAFSASDPPWGLLFEDKTRLGSTPPSCHNKCNECHPCIAVKVSPFWSFHRVQHPKRRVPRPTAMSEYTEYKPMGWKCRCKDHLYNP